MVHRIGQICLGPFVFDSDTTMFNDAPVHLCGRRTFQLELNSLVKSVMAHEFGCLSAVALCFQVSKGWPVGVAARAGGGGSWEAFRFESAL